MELREIEVFLVLAEELHFGRTAERLYLSPSRVSQSVRAMEARVGGTLFERTSRRVRLTALGEQQWDGLRPGFDQVRRAVAEARDAARGPDGELRVGLLSLAAGGSRFDTVVERFERRFPACRVEVLEAFPGEALERLRTGELDAIVHWLPLRQPGLAMGPVLLDAAPVLAVRVRHPLAERGWATLEDLGEHVVLDAEGVLPAEALDELVPRLTPAGRPIRRRFREGRMAEVLSLVARGRVVHPTVDSVGDHYRHPGPKRDVRHAHGRRRKIDTCPRRNGHPERADETRAESIMQTPLPPTELIIGGQERRSAILRQVRRTVVNHRQPAPKSGADCDPISPAPMPCSSSAPEPRPRACSMIPSKIA